MTKNIKIAAISLLIFLFASQAGAQSVWISDQFEVMLRTGPSTSNAIERMLPSGTALEVMERDDAAGYSRVRTAAGTEGWVLTRYLMNEPSAREQLATLTRRLTSANSEGSSLTSQLDAVRGEYDSASRQITALEGEKRRLEQELAEIKRTSANVLSINSQNKDLREQLANSEIQVATLQQQRAGAGCGHDPRHLVAAHPLATPLALRPLLVNWGRTAFFEIRPECWHRKTRFDPN
jgi:SH3 domain protein